MVECRARRLDAAPGPRNATTVGRRCHRASCVLLASSSSCAPGWPAMSLVVAGAIVVSWALESLRSRRRGRGRDPARAARPGLAGRQRRRLRRAAADGVRRADPLHRGGRRVPRARRAAPLRGRHVPRPGGDGRLQPAGRALVRVRAVRRGEPDGRGRERGRAHAAHRAGRGGPDPAHRRVPRPALHRPAGDGAGRDRDRGRLELPQRPPSCGAWRRCAGARSSWRASRA